MEANLGANSRLPGIGGATKPKVMEHCAGKRSNSKKKTCSVIDSIQVVPMEKKIKYFFSHNGEERKKSIQLTNPRMEYRTNWVLAKKS